MTHQHVIQECKGAGGKAPHILYLGTRYRYVLASRSVHLDTSTDLLKLDAR